MNSTNTTTPPYYISNVVASGCGSVLVPGDILYVNWDIYGDASYDTCYLGIRPISDLMTNDAVVAEAAPHTQCFGTSANIVIPKVPKNAAFPFNGSHFVARINTPDKLHADSCAFKYVVVIHSHCLLELIKAAGFEQHTKNHSPERTRCH